MNRCEEILAKKRNPLRSTDELRHSEVYKGVEFTEDLTHWKYIKKYKNSKGKTVYVYANKETHSNIQDTRAKAKSTYADALYENRKQKRYDDSSYTTGKSYGQDDMHSQWAKTYTKLGDVYTEDYNKLLSDNKPSKVIKRDVNKTIREIKDKVKEGTEFIKGYFKYLKEM
jgi:hypothetical protein